MQRSDYSVFGSGYRLQTQAKIYLFGLLRLNFSPH